MGDVYPNEKYLALNLIHDIRIDLGHSSACLSPPRFSDFEPFKPVSICTQTHPTPEEDKAIIESLDQRWGTDFPSTTMKSYEGMDPYQNNLLYRLRQLSNLKRKLGNPLADPCYQYIYLDHVMLLERQLNHFIWSPVMIETRSQWPAARKLGWEAWHTIFFVYLHWTLGEWSIATAISQKLVARFILAMQLRGEMGSHLHGFPPEFIAWSFLMAGTISKYH